MSEIQVVNEFEAQYEVSMEVSKDNSTEPKEIPVKVAQDPIQAENLVEVPIENTTSPLVDCHDKSAEGNKDITYFVDQHEVPAEANKQPTGFEDQCEVSVEVSEDPTQEILDQQYNQPQWGLVNDNNNASEFLQQHDSGDEIEGQLDGKIELSSEYGGDFLVHKVQKYDTLMALAVKYNVTIHDIKLFNNIFSDLQIYTKETLVIPKKTLPIDRDILARAACVASGGNIKRSMSQSSFRSHNSLHYIDCKEPNQDLELTNVSSLVKRLGHLEDDELDDRLQSQWNEQSEDKVYVSIDRAERVLRNYQRLAQARQGIVKRTASLGQTLGKGALTLGRSLRSVATNPGLLRRRSGQYGDLQNDVSRNGQATFVPGPALPEGIQYDSALKEMTSITAA